MSEVKRESEYLLNKLQITDEDGKQALTDFVTTKDQLQKVDKEGKKALTKLVTKEIIQTDAKPEQLHEEFKNLNLNKTLETIFYVLPKDVQDKLLQLAASLYFHSKGNQVKRGGGDDIIALDDATRREPNIYLTKPFVTSVLVFIFGLFLLFTAKNMASSLGAEYGLEINFAGFVGLFLNPLQSAKGTFQVIVKSLLDKMSAELAFKIEEGCGAAGGGWINNLLVAIQGPGEHFQCALDVGNKVMGAEMQVQQARIMTNLSNITNLLRSGYAMVGLAGGNIAVMIDGPDGKITRFIENIPGGTSVLRLMGHNVSNPLAITYGGGKRKSKKARKGKKSSKARKGRNSKKTRKSKKARKA